MSTGTAPYQEPDTALEDRIEDLVDRMTLEEKVGQLVGTVLGDVGDWLPGGDRETVRQQVQEHRLGSVAPFLPGGEADDPGSAVAVTNDLQRVAVEETRLGVPLLFPADAIHGHAYVDGATVFPHNLAMAATRDPSLVREVAAATRREMRATGATQNYNPTADVVRDTRWGRTYETYGESPHLVAEMVAAEVTGYQGDGLETGVLATPKHFPAYGRGERGEDAAPVAVTDTELHRSFLPPFAAGIAAGAGSVMPCYNAIDAEPVHGSRRYLHELLREHLGFDGLVVSDWNGIRMLHEDHRVTEDRRAAIARSRRAGVDVASVGGPEHAHLLADLVRTGDLPAVVIERSLERVLRVKFELGLFEDPYVDPDGTEAVGTAEHRELSLRAAREAMTLLCNDDDVLPFDRDCASVLVTGPNADNLVHQVGGWSGFEPQGTTVLEGVRELVDGSVTHEPGAGIRSATDVEAAADAAADADVAVVVLGENWYIHEFGPAALAGETGAFPTRSDLSLPAPQRRLLEAVHATGTPTALVLVTGRPLAIQWAAETVPAILLAYYPGASGGRAVAETLFGENEPGGSLPVSIPRSAGHLPTRFDHLPHPTPIGADEHPSSYDPLFPFGHGCSYTTFEHVSRSVTPETIAADGTVTVEVTVENVGERPCETAVHCYLRDDVSSRVTPVRELAGVERIALEPADRRTVTFEIRLQDFGVVDPAGDRHVEPGTYTVIVGDWETTVTVTD